MLTRMDAGLDRLHVSVTANLLKQDKICVLVEC